MGNMFKCPGNAGVIQGKSGYNECSKRTSFWVLFVTILGSGMAFIDGTAINVALPVLQSELNATVVDVQWVVESYALFLAALILVGGSLGDKFGRKLIYKIGIVIFSVSSALCGFAQNVDQLIAARAIQGIGAALLVPGSLSIISSFFSVEERGKAIGTWAGFATITAALGPVLGGWLIENHSWRWIFYINIPIAVIVLTVLLFRVPESRDEDYPSLDYYGAAAVTLGLGGIVFGLVESSIYGFNNLVVILSLIIGMAFFCLFIYIEKTVDNPMVPLSLFKSKQFTGANIITFLIYSALGGALFFIPFDFIQVHKYSATKAGMAFLPFILLMFFLSRPMGIIVDKYGARTPLVVGSILSGFGYLLFSLAGHDGHYWSNFFPAIVVLGLGKALCVAPLSTSVMTAVSENNVGVASGINNAVTRTAALVSIAVFGILVFTFFNSRLDLHIEAMTFQDYVREILKDQRIRLAAAELPHTIDVEMGKHLRYAINNSFLHGFNIILYISAGLCFISSVVAYFMVPSKKNMI